jgi:hypothetical protein
MTIDDLVQALECAMKGERIDERLLKDKKVKENLTAYFIEKETRPELVALIAFPDLMKDYLDLPVKLRETLEALRQKRPEYLEGNINYHAAPGERIQKEVRELYNEIHFRKAIPQIVEGFIQYQPQSTLGIISLKMWFEAFEPVTGKRLIYHKSGKKVQKGTPLGSKYLARWKESNGRRKGPTFEQWVESKLPKALIEKLKQTAYYQQQEDTIEDIVKTYIKQSPENVFGPVGLTAYFQSHDIKAGKRVICKKNGKTSSSSTPQGRRFYSQYLKGEEKKQGRAFEQWIKSRISPALAQKLDTMPYYANKEWKIEDIVRSYIKNAPRNKFGPVPLKNWFFAYNSENGEHVGSKTKEITKTPQGQRYHAQWFTNERKSGMTFDSWIESQINPTLAARIKKTAYYTQETPATMDQVIDAYITNRPHAKFGQVTLKTWCSIYDIKTGKPTRFMKNSRWVQKNTKRQGLHFYTRWKNSDDKKQGVEFEEWALSQSSKNLQNSYLRQVYGIEKGTEILEALEQVTSQHQIKLNVLRNSSVKNALTAYYIEKELHPEIMSLSPYQTLLYLNTKPEEREAVLKQAQRA